MKKFTAFFLATLMLLSVLTACGAGSGTGGNSAVDKSVTGVWYSAYDSAVLDIPENGKGTITFEGTAYDAQFSAQGGVFTAASQGYSFSGNYKVESDILTVTISYKGVAYDALFTREKVQIAEELIGSHVYMVGEEAYEITISEETVICKGLPFPPSDDYPEVTITVIPKIPTGGTPDAPTQTLQVTPAPPAEIFVEKKPESTTPPEDASTPETQPEETKPAETKPEETKPVEKTPDFLPDEISLTDGKVSVTKDGENQETTKGGGSIVGTWTSEKQKGQAYIFGHSSDFDYTVTFTFNEDGTGTCFALIFPGTLKWKLTGHRLDLTISMIGDTESGTGYVTIVGDVMYLVNHKGERYALTRTA